MKTELWVVRDGRHHKNIVSDLRLFNAEPVLDAEGFFIPTYGEDWPLELDTGMFPELKPGEKRRVRLVLEPVEEDDDQ